MQDAYSFHFHFFALYWCISQICALGVELITWRQPTLQPAFAKPSH